MGYFSNLLGHNAVLKITNGTDSNGVPIIVSEREIKCKMEFSDSLVFASDGQKHNVSGRIFTEADLKSTDIINFNGKDYSVAKVVPLFAPDGKNSVNEVYFQ